jgi:acyl-coenzyme A synthetase/AMP-(fatty) acid ligase
MNFATRILEEQRPSAVALVERSRDGRRRVWSFPEVRTGVEYVAAALHGLGLERGDVVITLVGNRPGWVFAMLAAVRQG